MGTKGKKAGDTDHPGPWVQFPAHTGSLRLFRQVLSLPSGSRLQKPVLPCEERIGKAGASVHVFVFPAAPRVRFSIAFQPTKVEGG